MSYYESLTQLLEPFSNIGIHLVTEDNSRLHGHMVIEARYGDRHIRVRKDVKEGDDHAAILDDIAKSIMLVIYTQGVYHFYENNNNKQYGVTTWLRDEKTGFWWKLKSIEDGVAFATMTNAVNPNDPKELEAATQLDFDLQTDSVGEVARQLKEHLHPQSNKS